MNTIDHHTQQKHSNKHAGSVTERAIALTTVLLWAYRSGVNKRALTALELTVAAVQSIANGLYCK